MIPPELEVQLDHLIATEGRTSKVYVKFVDALRRLVATPQVPILCAEFVEMAEEGQHIKVTITNVAREAEVNPQRFSGPMSDFKRLSALVKAYHPTMGVVEKTTARLDRQAERIRTLEQQLVAARSRLAETVVVEDDLRTELRDARLEVDRLKKRAA